MHINSACSVSLLTVVLIREMLPSFAALGVPGKWMDGNYYRSNCVSPINVLVREDRTERHLW